MYKKILVPVDGSTPSTLGLLEAIKLAKGYGSQLQLVHVVNELIIGAAETPMYFESIVESLRLQGKNVLAEAERLVREHALEPSAVLLESIGGRAADRVIEQARQWNAELIVIGTHGRRGLKRLALGSDAELIVRLSPVPVLLVREQTA